MKRSNIEIERSILQIQDWIIEGIGYGQIVLSCIESGWCMSERQATTLIKRAKDRWVEEDSVATREKRAVKVKELEALIDSMKQSYKGTPAGMLAVARIQALIIKLTGIAAPVKVELGGPNGGPVAVAHTIEDDIDYDKLPIEVLQAIADARKKPKD